MRQPSRRSARNRPTNGERSAASPNRSRQAKKSRRRRQRARNRLQRVTSHAPRIRLVQRTRSRPTGALWNGLAAGFALAFAIAGAVAARPVAQAAIGWWQGSPATLEQMAAFGRRQLTPAQIAAASGLEPGMRLGGIESAAIANRLAQHDWIASADAMVLPGGTTLLAIEERVPEAILFTPDTSEPQLVDASGTVFTKARAEDLANDHLIRLHGPKEATTEPPHAMLASAILLARAVSSFESLEDVEIEIPSFGGDRTAEDGFVLRSADGGLTILLGPDSDSRALAGDDLSQRLDRLRGILDAGLFEAPARGQIDLRFEDQAVLRGSLRSDTERNAASVPFSEGEG